MCVLSPGRYKTEIQQSTSSDIDGTRVGLVWRASRGYISGRGITSAAQSSLQLSLGVAWLNFLFSNLLLQGIMSQTLKITIKTIQWRLGPIKSVLVFFSSA